MRTTRPRLLVVDDMADAADSQAMILRLWGYDTEVAYDGSAALALARAFPPRAVVLDIGMPGMDGFRLSLLLRQLPGLANVRLIAVTGYTSPAHRVRAAELGFAQYLLKPVDPERLKALLEGLIGRPQPRARVTARPPRPLLPADASGR